MNLRKWLAQVGYEDLSEVLVDSIDRKEPIRETIKYMSNLYEISSDESNIELLLDQIIDLTYNLR